MPNIETRLFQIIARLKIIQWLLGCYFRTDKGILGHYWTIKGISTEGFYMHYTIHHNRISILNRSYFLQFWTNLSKTCDAKSLQNILSAQNHWSWQKKVILVHTLDQSKSIQNGLDILVEDSTLPRTTFTIIILRPLILKVNRAHDSHSNT